MPETSISVIILVSQKHNDTIIVTFCFSVTNIYYFFHSPKQTGENLFILRFGILSVLKDVDCLMATDFENGDNRLAGTH